MLGDVVTVVGIDVGGRKKGFHGVALRDGAYRERFQSVDAQAMAAWVRRLGAPAVGVDAPCRFSADGRMRSAERELARGGIPCFATPSQARARAHGFYAWMLNGMSLYEALSPAYRLLDAPSRPAPSERVCFETYPQAVACALAGRRLSGRNKRSERRELLEAAGIAADGLGPLDFVDAALCAVAAHCFVRGRYEALGEAADGFIVVPARGFGRPAGRLPTGAGRVHGGAGLNEAHDGRAARPKTGGPRRGRP